MKTFGQALDLVDDPDLIAEYEARHRAVWPEVKAALRSIGIVEMKIFRIGNRLFMTFEAPDDFVPERDFLAYTEVMRAREWDDLMRRFQRPVPAAPEGVWWAAMTKVFDIDWE